MNDERRQALTAEVEAHPEWTDEQVGDALERAGARFGPADREAFLAQAATTRLAPFLKSFTLNAAEFMIDRGGGGSPYIRWAIELRSGQPTPWGNECLLSYEPFDGRLTGFTVSSVPLPPHGR